MRAYLKSHDAGQNETWEVTMSRKKGVESYRENPFVVTADVPVKNRRVTVSSDRRAITNLETGELEHVAEIVRIQQVDAGQFVKLFTADLKRFFDLQPTTMKLVQVLLVQVQKAPNTDRVILNMGVAEEYFTRADLPKMSKASFHRAVRELLDKKFIAECAMMQGLYFINPALFFNGDRVRFVEEYRRTRPDAVRDESRRVTGGQKELAGQVIPDVRQLDLESVLAEHAEKS